MPGEGFGQLPTAEWKRQEGNGRSDAERLSMSGILRRVETSRGASSTCRARNPKGGNERYGRRQNVANLMTGSRVQQTCERRCGLNQRGGEKPRGWSTPEAWRRKGQNTACCVGSGCSVRCRWRGGYLDESHERQRSPLRRVTRHDESALKKR